MAARRSVDWEVLFPSERLEAGPSQRVSSPELAQLLAHVDALLAIDDVDEILKRAVEIARDEVGLSRAGILVFDEEANAMLGTWGTNEKGQTQDEHEVMYEFGDWDRLAYERARSGASRWTVFENCPVVSHGDHESIVLGRGDVACTPIYSSRRLHGLMFNTGREIGGDLREEAQSLGAVLCSRLGPLLEFSGAPDSGDSTARRLSSARESPQVVRAVQMLGRDPTLSGSHLAKALGMSASSLGRQFTKELGMSIVDYRNHLRLDRFFALVDPRGGNLLQAALDAGFGSYTQFHRVFRAKYEVSAKDFLAKQAREPVRKK
jgi:AraC-like DNA-binding protein